MIGFADFRARFEPWWDARIVEGKRAKSPYVGFEELNERLDALVPEAPQRRWVFEILIDWLSSEDTLRWLPAISILRQQRVASAVPALREAAESASTAEKRDAADTLCRAADEIEEALGGAARSESPSSVPDAVEEGHAVDAFFAGSSGWTPEAAPPPRPSTSVPADFRQQFEEWHEALVAEGIGRRDPNAVDEAVNERIESVADGSPERQWLYSILTDWLFSPDPWRWHPALETLSQKRVREAIPAIRAAVDPPNSDEKARWAPTFEQVVQWIENGPPLDDD